jgi:hypothetical protein
MDNKVEIYDDYLPNLEFQLIKTQLFNTYFPWYLNKVLEPNHVNTKTLTESYNFQMVHMFYDDYVPKSSGMELLNPIITKLNPRALLRIKANLTFKTPKIVEHGYHTDFPENEPCTTGVYYLNSTDGYTKFSNGEVIEGIENRLVLFDSRILHTGTTCTNADARCVLNINFIP